MVFLWQTKRTRLMISNSSLTASISGQRENRWSGKVWITFLLHFKTTSELIWQYGQFLQFPIEKKCGKEKQLGYYWKKGSVFRDLYHYLFVLSPSQQLYPSIGSWLSQLGLFYCYIDRNRVIDYFLFLLDLSILW